MDILLHDGKKPVLLKGSDGEFSICFQKKRKDKAGKTFETWEPYNWFSTLAGGLDCVFRLKVSNSDATTLSELQAVVREIRQEIIDGYTRDGL